MDVPDTAWDRYRAPAIFTPLAAASRVMPPPLIQRIQQHADTAARLSLVGAFLCFPLAIGAANTLTALVLLLWPLSGHFRQRWGVIRRSPITAPTLALCALIVLGTLYSSAPAHDIWTHLVKYSKLLYVLLFLSLLDSPTWRHRCAWAFAGAMGVILASVYANIWLDLPWSQTHNQGWGMDHHVIGDYITQNIMMVFFVVLACAWAAQATAPWRKGLGWSVAVAGALSVTHLSEGRTGAVLLAVALVTLALVRVAPRWRLPAAALALAVLTVGVLSSDTMQKRFERAVAEARNHEADNLSSIGHRLYNYKKVPQLILERPLTGWGTGGYHQQICRIVEKPEWCAVFNWHPHNQFLFFGVEHGVLAMLLYALLLGGIAWQARHRKGPDKTLVLCFVAIFLVDSLFNSPLWSARESHFFTFIMALLMAGPLWATSGAPGTAGAHGPSPAPHT